MKIFNATLPEVYTNDGEELTIMEIENTAKEPIKEKVFSTIVQANEKKINHIALVKVERCIIDNTGKIHCVTSKNVYTREIFDNEQTYMTYKRGYNWGYRTKDNALVTTTGISQIDYFRNYGTRVSILKMINRAIKISDLFSYGDLFMTGSESPLPLGSAVGGPVGVTAGVLLNVMTMKYANEIKAMIDKQIYEGMQIAKAKGLDEVEKEARKYEYLKKDNKYSTYDLLLISSSTTQDILSGKIINWGDVKRQEKGQITLLYIWNPIEKTATIETFFINQ